WSEKARASGDLEQLSLATLGYSARSRLQRVFAIGDPACGFLDDQVHFGTDRNREVRYFVARRKIHEDRNVEIRYQIEEKILEFIFFRPVERQLTKDDSSHAPQQSGRAQVEQLFVDNAHGIAGLLEEE